MTVKKLLATVVLNGAITEIALPAGYRNYYISGEAITRPAAGSDNDFQLRLGTVGSPDVTTSNYSTQYYFGTSTTESAARVTANGGIRIPPTEIVSSEVIDFYVTLLNPLSTSVRTSGYYLGARRGASGNQLISTAAFAHHAAATAHTHIHVGCTVAADSTSSLVACPSGTIYIYGEE